jgi:hypothetical protein
VNDLNETFNEEIVENEETVENFTMVENESETELALA